MKIRPLNLSDRRQVQEFMHLSFQIYRNIPQWVPPLEMDMRLLLNPKKHPFYRHSEAIFLMAYELERPVGRIAVLDNRRYNDYNHEKTAFFYLFECEENPAAAKALFGAAFGWARGRGLERMAGPKGFTPLDGGGILVEGFEHAPAFGMPYTPRYYVRLLEEAGFLPEHETVSGYLYVETAQFPERVHELAQRVAERRGLRVRTFRRRSELRELVNSLKDLYNSSLEGTSGNFPLSDEDVAGLADMLLLFADPRLIKLVMKGDRVVGFLLAYPDVSKALQKTRGRLFPLGWITFLRELRRTELININGMGLLEEYRGLGGTAILASEIAKSLMSNPRYRKADIVQIGTENDKMQREISNFGVDFCKKHRTYQINL